jgi:cytidylate kinase
MTHADSPSARPAAPVVTIASLHGAGGHLVGEHVAQRLGVPFLDRGILSGIAEQMRLPESAVAEFDADTPKDPRSPLRRYFDSLGRAATGDATPASDVELEEGRYRAETEEFLARAAARGGVLLGRGGAVVLRALPGALHVMLSAPQKARVRQIMQRDGVDQDTARRRVVANDRARRGYVRRSYGVDPENPDLYHLRIDTTVLDLDTCVDLIVTASRGRRPVAAATADG